MPESASGAGALCLELEVGGTGIAWLTLRATEGEALLGSAVLPRLDEILSELEPRIAAGEVRAVVVRGAHSGVFVAGSDLDELRAFTDAAEATLWALAGQRTLRRLEELPVPTIAAIDGACLEAGLELALACSYRLASDSPGTRLGLPQVRLGILPAFGGTVRLPRLVGIQAALDLILPGREVPPEEAFRLGLVDRLLPARQFAAGVEAFAEERIERGRIRTGARRRVPRRLLEDTAPGRRLVLRRASRGIGPRAEHPDGAAAPRALRAVAEGLSLPLERAFRREAEVAGELLTSPQARGLLHASAALRRARGAAAPAPERPIGRVGILGAGAVGSELAFLLTGADVSVLLKDRRRDALLRGVRHVLALLRREERVGRISGDDARRRETRVASASGFGGFGTLDLVITAVGSGGDPSDEALREAGEHTRHDCVLASASLTASPRRAQQGLEHPERAVGLRFSRPTDLFPLLEIVAGDFTGRPAVDACLDLGRRLGRVPMVVPDRPDTPGNRLLGALLAEALCLLEEGSSLVEIDGTAEAFGFPLGPFRRMDAMGVERCLALLAALQERCGVRFRRSPIVDRLSEPPPLFYRYRKGLPIRPNEGLPARLPAHGEGHGEVIRSRLVLSLIQEAVRVLQEIPLLDAERVDVAALAGVGFPGGRGGPLFQADEMGPARLVERLEELAERFGERFAPAPLLLEVAARGGRFHAAATGHRPPGVLR